MQQQARPAAPRLATVTSQAHPWATSISRTMWDAMAELHPAKRNFWSLSSDLATPSKETYSRLVSNAFPCMQYTKRALSLQLETQMVGAFRLEAADTHNKDWVTPDLHAQFFHGMAIRLEGWCLLCHFITHLKESCPLRSDAGWKQLGPPSSRRTCGNFNLSSKGRCHFFPRYNSHVCKKGHTHDPNTQGWSVESQDRAVV